MNIEQAARSCGITAKMIRYYERIGLIPEVDRKPNKYRDYNDADVDRLSFIRQAHDLGFSLESVRDLLDLWRDRTRNSTEVRTLALGYLSVLEGKAAELASMRKVLHRLAQACDVDQGPEVPKFEDRVGTCRRPSRAH